MDSYGRESSLPRLTLWAEYYADETSLDLATSQALIDTDIPNPRCLNSVQSPTHGLILFCPVDDNLTRIGYVFSEHLQKKWKLGEETVAGPAVENGGLGGLKLEAVIEEAQEAVKPFRLDFKRVDWYTIYVSNETWLEISRS
jgi:phenol 2-monooxygenase